MNRLLPLALSLVALTGCLNVNDARAGGARRSCDYAQRCGNIGSGQQYATFDECLTKQNASWLNTWPTDRCDGRINGDALGVCYRAIENTRCDDFLDAIATASKCSAGDVCSAGSNTGCNCGQGQTCCNNACVNLTNDRNNCGTCGTVCGSGSICNAGSCR